MFEYCQFTDRGHGDESEEAPAMKTTTARTPEEQEAYYARFDAARAQGAGLVAAYAAADATPDQETPAMKTRSTISDGTCTFPPATRYADTDTRTPEQIRASIEARKLAVAARALEVAGRPDSR